MFNTAMCQEEHAGVSNLLIFVSPVTLLVCPQNYLSDCWYVSTLCVSHIVVLFVFRGIFGTQ